MKNESSVEASLGGLPGWAWPVIGLVGGLTLVVVVYGSCFVDPDCK